MRLLPQKQPLSIYNLTGGNKIHQAFLVLLPVIIVYEIVFLLSVPSWVIQFSIAFVLLFAIVFSALKFGMVPALITAAIANAYILFALGGPGRNIVPLQNMLDGEWLIFLIFFFPAILIGYLSDRIKLLILNERQAKEMAEQERLQLATMIEQMP